MMIAREKLLCLLFHGFYEFLWGMIFKIIKQY